MRDPPDQEALKTLHERLQRGDRLASEELARLLLPALLEEVSRRFPRTDEQLISDGVIDAVLDYCEVPDQFDPGKEVPLDRFLSTAAWRNVDNLLISERRRKEREKKAGRKKREADVALDPAARNIQREEQEQCDKRKAALLAALDDPKDREIMALRLEGVRDTAAYARILNITDLPIQRQREEVKRHKDRITRFLRRKGLLK
jgi:RNA polymerase sigma-70 factor (ECF subfamily)